MNNYYVYVYCNPLKILNEKIGKYHFEFEPFYIGYGINNRCYSHLKRKSDSNKHKFNTIRMLIESNIKPVIIKLESCLEKENAKQFEKDLISLIGTIKNIPNIKRGSLTNMTPGGDGGDTFSGRKHKQESIKKMKYARSLQIFSDETKQKIRVSQQNRDIQISDKQREAMINGLRNLSSDSWNNISKATKNTVWIYKENIRKRISPDELNQYLIDGWVKGFKIK